MKRLFMNHRIFIIVDRSRRSNGSTFKSKIRMEKKGDKAYASISIPPHVIEKEKLRKEDEVRFRIESIEE